MPVDPKRAHLGVCAEKYVYQLRKPDPKPYWEELEGIKELFDYRVQEHIDSCMHNLDKLKRLIPEIPLSEKPHAQIRYAFKKAAGNGSLGIYNYLRSLFVEDMTAYSAFCAKAANTGFPWWSDNEEEEEWCRLRSVFGDGKSYVYYTDLGEAFCSALEANDLCGSPGDIDHFAIADHIMAIVYDGPNYGAAVGKAHGYGEYYARDRFAEKAVGKAIQLGYPYERFAERMAAFQACGEDVLGTILAAAVNDNCMDVFERALSNLVSEERKSAFRKAQENESTWQKGWKWTLEHAVELAIIQAIWKERNFFRPTFAMMIFPVYLDARLPCGSLRRFCIEPLEGFTVALCRASMTHDQCKELIRRFRDPFDMPDEFRGVLLDRRREDSGAPVLKWCGLVRGLHRRKRLLARPSFDASAVGERDTTSTLLSFIASAVIFCVGVLFAVSCTRG
ncbi:uncharacterized protein DSM5745_03703 [Aspergillus mulundensis]|uniref:Uncharacterized protein n=1 Tax=Aspergillus mulundensis TaxID=1810919 RepID=A0A3D8SLK3_9EURO|nr:hypothetical protein DSM5745_03703 [Aspergillus mulundensis]RDW87061.1 hypothetical protein DSM5745_03703 [Aspergillus mulundensis]